MPRNGVRPAFPVIRAPRVTSPLMSTTAPDLAAAADVIETAAGLVRSGIRQLVANGGPDAQQLLAYDLAHAAAQVETARALLDYGVKGEREALITCAFTADMLHDLISRIIGREDSWGVQMASVRDSGPIPRHLPVGRVHRLAGAATRCEPSRRRHGDGG